MKYSSEGIPLPLEMGMDEDEENFLFYEPIELKKGNKVLEGKLNKKTKALSVYENNTIVAVVDFREINNMLDETVSAKNQGEEIEKIRQERQEKIDKDFNRNIKSKIKKLSIVFQVESIRACYIHYKLFLSQGKVGLN